MPQNIAANRTAGFSDSMVLDIGQAKIGYVWPKKTTAPQMQIFCAQSDILISPNFKQDLTGDCIHISQSYLRYNGAVSIHFKDGSPIIESARQVTGTRLWNTWWLRK